MFFSHIFVIIISLIIVVTAETTLPLTHSLKQLSNCRRPLGMHDGSIPDHAISASSSFNDPDVGPLHARMRNEKKGGAWCPKNPIEDGVYEWIQVDLLGVKVITHVETQGRFGKGEGKEFVGRYRLEHKRVEGGRFVVYKDKDGNEFFTGNSDTYTAKINEINPPIISRWIRLVPLSTYPKSICLRFELHGCSWRDGILSYNMPQGEQRTGGAELLDLAYDGEAIPINNIGENNSDSSYSNAVDGGGGNNAGDAGGERGGSGGNYKFYGGGRSKSRKKTQNKKSLGRNNNYSSMNIWLYGGLGQLVDGTEGHGIFNFAKDKPAAMAKEWVGWKNDSIWNFMKNNNNDGAEDDDENGEDDGDEDGFNDGVNDGAKHEARDKDNKSIDRKNKEILFSKLPGKKKSDGNVNHADAGGDGSNKKSFVHYSTMLRHYNTQMYKEPVVSLIFEFERPRSFSSVRIHCHNMFKRGIKMFKLAVLYFSFYADFRDEPSLFKKNKSYADFDAQRKRQKRDTNSQRSNHNHSKKSPHIHPSHQQQVADRFDSLKPHHGPLEHSQSHLLPWPQNLYQHPHKQQQQQHRKQEFLRHNYPCPQHEKPPARIKKPQNSNLLHLRSKRCSAYRNPQDKDLSDNFLDQEYSTNTSKLSKNSKSFAKILRFGNLEKNVESLRSLRPSKRHVNDRHDDDNSPPVVNFTTRDTLLDLPRNVNIMIPKRVGRYVRADLYFDDEWLWISEVRFESELLSENSTRSSARNQEKHGTFSKNLKRPYHNQSDKRDGSYNLLARNKQPIDDRLIGIIIGAVGIPIIILLVLILLCLYCHLKHKSNNEKLTEEETKSNKHTTDGIPLKKMENNGYYTYNNTIFNQNNYTLRHNANKNANSALNGSSGQFLNHSNDTNATTITSLGTTLRKNLSDHDKMLKFTFNNHTGTIDQGAWEGNDPFQSVSPLQRELPDVPLIPFDSNGYLSDANNSTYAVPDHYRVGLPPSSYPSENIYHSDLLNDPTTSHLSRTLLTHKSESKDVPNWNNVSHLKRRNLRLIKKLGEGVFGEVHLCELNTSVQASGLSMSRMIGAVKVLTNSASHKITNNFLQEVKVMSRLSDPNVVAVLGVCLKDQPWFVVFEYTSKGDLTQFLKSRMASEQTTTRKMATLKEGNTQTLSYGSLVYMACQISSGMKYLESSNVVHRDLATRNCLVGSQLQVKISDLGVISDLYRADYFRLQSHTLLPIRWMSWEAVVLGKFSSKSDVWSFGVTLWEVMNHAVKRPFEELSDQEVLEGLAQCPQTGNIPFCLEQPTNCPREIYDLMCECWNADETKRPTFSEICMFLSRKNMGYKPSDDYVDDDFCVLDEYEKALEGGFPFSEMGESGGNLGNKVVEYVDGGSEGNGEIEKSTSKRSVLV